jgi:hypothetical protein
MKFTIWTRSVAQRCCTRRWPWWCNYAGLVPERTSLRVGASGGASAGGPRDRFLAHSHRRRFGPSAQRDQGARSS